MKKQPSKVGYCSKIAKILYTAGWPKTRPISNSFFLNSSPHDLYTMTLGIYTVGLCKHYFCRVIVFLMISEATWGCCHHHTTTTVFSRLLKLLLLRHLAAAAASTLHPQSKFCFPGAQPCVLLQSSKLLKEKLKGLHGSSMGCLLLLCLRTDSWLVDNSCSST